MEISGNKLDFFEKQFREGFPDLLVLHIIRKLCNPVNNAKKKSGCSHHCKVLYLLLLDTAIVSSLSSFPTCFIKMCSSVPTILEKEDSQFYL